MCAIPKEWLHTTQSKPMHVLKRHESIQVKTNKILNDTIKVKCKDFYSELINKKYTMPKCVEKWEEKYFYVNFYWQQIYPISFVVARETALQGFRYRIINKYLPCNVALTL